MRCGRRCDDSERGVGRPVGAKDSTEGEGGLCVVCLIYSGSASPLPRRLVSVNATGAGAQGKGIAHKAFRTFQVSG